MIIYIYSVIFSVSYLLIIRDDWDLLLNTQVIKMTAIKDQQERITNILYTLYVI